MTEITGLVCEYRANPLGIDVTAPRFGWRMVTPRQHARQTAYRVLVASDPARLSVDHADLWDSGPVASDQAAHVVYAGTPLTSRQRAYWRVIVTDETGAEIPSDPAWFELGLLDRTDWRGDWIGAPVSGGPRSTIPAPYLRKEFELPEAVQSARLYVTALGLFACTLNGQRVSDDVFTPGWSDYHQRVQYNVYDVTDLLHTGANAVGAILGDGWAVGHVGWGERQQYANAPRLLAQLEITCADGQTHTLITDDSWRYIFGPLLENDLLMGEAYDARRALPGWDQPAFDDQDWSAVKIFDDPGIALVATNGPTVRRHEELMPIADPIIRSTHHQPRAIFDLGQNMVGWVRLRGRAPAGTTIRLRFAEMLDDEGELYTENLRSARATDYYTFSGSGEEVWEPHFTFHGFRYVELFGYPGEITRDTITGIVVHSEMAQTGDFACSDPLLNQLQHNIVWGQKGNFVDVPTDCPQRDERLGWTGDIQVFAQTAAFNMQIAPFMTKWLRDVRDAQSAAGAIPPVVPRASGTDEDGGPAWADAVIICPWTIYQQYGDTRILAENYATMTRFMDFITAESPNLIRCAPDYTGWQGYGDWLSINADTPRDLIGTAFLAYDARLMAQIADILGHADDAARYAQLFTDTQAAFSAHFLVGGTLSAPEVAITTPELERANATSRGNLQVVDYGPVESDVFNTDRFTPTQTAYVLALHFDLLPDELRAQAAAELVMDIERRDMHLSTGFVGAPYLPHVLSAADQLDTAYALLHQESWPSWLYAVTQGATTIWERWDGWTEESGFQNPGMNSFNHYAYGSIGAWLYGVVAGINVDPQQPGYQHSILRPQPGGKLTSARATLHTHYGELSSAWEIVDDRFEWTVTIPPNATATLYIPERTGDTARPFAQRFDGLQRAVGAGTHVIVVD